MVYIKIHPLSDKKVPMKSFVFNIDDGIFERVTPSKIENIEDRKFFTPNDKGGFKAARRKNEYKQMILKEWGRDYRTLRRSHNEKATSFPVGTVLVLSQPHKYVYKRNKTTHHKYVYDALNYTFYVVSNEFYKDSGLSKHQRGNVVTFNGKEWKRLGRKIDATFHKTLNELDAQHISNEVSDNVMFWKAKSKYERHCETCIFGCKQNALVKLPYCSMYKTPKGVNKRRFTINDQ